MECGGLITLSLDGPPLFLRHDRLPPLFFPPAACRTYKRLGRHLSYRRPTPQEQAQTEVGFRVCTCKP